MVFDRKSIPIVACKQNQQSRRHWWQYRQNLPATKNKTTYET